mgnify:CR=1 FL=1
MVTDGVLDALPVGEQEAMLGALIGGTTICNPEELAHYILEQVLELSGEIPADDMTVLAVGYGRHHRRTGRSIGERLAFSAEFYILWITDRSVLARRNRGSVFR